ncbi:hypothetical protein BBOV_III005400 [Babesia bovis T2Bo]|uniref:Uncharacterized protein n=1 Tax=Babesia bovis TaxID=5865 RepID=A7ANG9_BABBO|nr:hypothetical protein BBOV_III005400 [Babesia bovis T2Bo]EDO08103.1 hypothetical protein BBOV_III005400 [Babesia bovis T2Bo]|eukprot:XP_001611671.1 hypothetical protein [Babesia bovis T2Bo]
MNMKNNYKRHKGGYSRNKNEGSYDTHVQIDEALYMANRNAAIKLKESILKRENAEDFALGPCQFRRISTFQKVDSRPRPSMQKTEGTTKFCVMCPSSMQKEIELSQSQTVYLAMEQQRHAIQGDQLIIAPKQHVQSTLYLDDNTYTELRNYQKTLVKMFYEQDKTVLFIETALSDPYLRNKEDGGSRPQQHCYIQCFPIPLEALDDAKSMFRKALDDLVPDWAHNRKLMNVTGKTGVRDVMPKGFDFIHVDFGLSGEGIACVIEDLNRITPHFAREVVAGVLHMDSMERAFRSTDKYMQALSWLRRQYKNYDWVIQE